MSLFGDKAPRFDPATDREWADLTVEQDLLTVLNRAAGAPPNNQLVVLAVTTFDATISLAAAVLIELHAIRAKICPIRVGHRIRLWRPGSSHSGMPGTVSEIIDADGLGRFLVEIDAAALIQPDPAHPETAMTLASGDDILSIQEPIAEA